MPVSIPRAYQRYPAGPAGGASSSYICTHASACGASGPARSQAPHHTHNTHTRARALAHAHTAVTLPSVTAVSLLHSAQRSLASRAKPSCMRAAPNESPRCCAAFAVSCVRSRRQKWPHARRPTFGAFGAPPSLLRAATPAPLLRGCLALDHTSAAARRRVGPQGAPGLPPLLQQWAAALPYLPNRLHAGNQHSIVSTNRHLLGGSQDEQGAAESAWSELMARHIMITCGGWLAPAKTGRD
jgi:hypothetical protein